MPKYNKRLYDIWRGMKRRCFEVSHPSYKNYGKRGIIVCDKWINDYTAFRDWAVINGYTDELTIDRIDNNGNYEPTNCRWIPFSENCLGKRDNVYITIGNATKTMSEWAEITNLSRQVLSSRYSKSKSLDYLFRPTNKTQ